MRAPVIPIAVRDIGVRRGGDSLRAFSAGKDCHFHRFLDPVGAVVQTGQNVAMQIVHSLSQSERTQKKSAPPNSIHSIRVKPNRVRFIIQSLRIVYHKIRQIARKNSFHGDMTAFFSQSHKKWLYLIKFSGNIGVRIPFIRPGGAHGDTVCRTRKRFFCAKAGQESKRFGKRGARIRRGAPFPCAPRLSHALKSAPVGCRTPARSGRLRQR